MTDEQLDALERKWEKEFGGKDVCELIAEVRRLRSFETGPPSQRLSPETASVEWRSDSHQSMDEAVEEIERRFLDQTFDLSGYACPQCLKDGVSPCQHQDGDGRTE